MNDHFEDAGTLGRQTDVTADIKRTAGHQVIACDLGQSHAALGVVGQQPEGLQRDRQHDVRPLGQPEQAAQGFGCERTIREPCEHLEPGDGRGQQLGRMVPPERLEDRRRVRPGKFESRSGHLGRPCWRRGIMGRTRRVPHRI
jgi:hypothetical protein